MVNSVKRCKVKILAVSLPIFAKLLNGWLLEWDYFLIFGRAGALFIYFLRGLIGLLIDLASRGLRGSSRDCSRRAHGMVRLGQGQVKEGSGKIGAGFRQG